MTVKGSARRRTPAPTEVTRLIQQVHAGDERARSDLWILVYDELRRLAAGQMSQERQAHTLQPTALVHEAWLRLAADPSAGSRNRAHFFGVAAEAMRRILVEHARRRASDRRGGGMARIGLSDVSRIDDLAGEDLGPAADLEALDQAVARLEASGRHPRKCRVVNLRFFVGLTIEQAAEVLGVSPASVKRDWEFAKAWLSRDIARARGGAR